MDNQETRYVPYSVFIKQYLKNHSIFFDDFKDMDNNKFKEMYNIEKSQINNDAITEYKTKHPYSYEKAKKEFLQKQREKQQEQQEQYENLRKEENIKMVMRQTNYTYEEAKKQLEQMNYQTIDVIRDYIKRDNREKRNKERENLQQRIGQPKSVNQQIYTEIRRFMDKNADNVRI